MSRYQHMLRPCPVGMNSAIELSAIPLEEAPLIRGFLPARHANLNLAHIPARLTRITPDGSEVLTLAFYRDRHRAAIGETDSRDLLVVFRKPPFHTTVETFRLRKTELVGGKLVLEPVSPQFLTIPDYLAEKPLDPSQGTWCPQIRWVQYNDELIFCSGHGSRPKRLWTDEAGTIHIDSLGINRADADLSGLTTVSNSVVSSWHEEPTALPWYPGMDPTKEYSYRLIVCDEKKRMGDVSDTFTVSAGVAPNNAIWHYVHEYAWKDFGGTFTGQTYIALARAMQGTNDYRIIRNWLNGEIYTPVVHNADTLIIDFNADTEQLQYQPTAPLPGDNTPPDLCSIVAVHGDRIILNDASYGSIVDGVADYSDPASLSRIQVSTVLEPTHFPVSVDLNNLASGTTLSIGHDIGDEITGLCSIGSFLGVWMRHAFWQLNGTSVNDWSLYKVHTKGCVSQETIKLCENLVIYLSDDGVYAMGMGEGLASQCMSTKVSNYFSGPVLGATTLDGKVVEY